MTLKSKLKIASAAALALIGSAGIAQADLITNGNFTQGSPQNPVTSSHPLDAVTQSEGGVGGTIENLTGWTATGYAFVFTNASASVGSLSMDSNTQNHNPASNFVAIDPVYHSPGSLSQVLSGLTIGNTYTVTFDWAGTQQSGYSNLPNFEYWTVQFNDLFHSTSASYNTTQVGSNGTAGGYFSGWFYDVSFDFVATYTTETLAFLAQGGPTTADPPFDLLANVRAVQKTNVPEPASIAMFGAGLAGFAGFAAMRRRKNKKS